MTHDSGKASGIPSMECRVCVGMPMIGLRVMPVLEESGYLVSSLAPLGMTRPPESSPPPFSPGQRRFPRRGSRHHPLFRLRDQLVHDRREVAGPLVGGELAVGAGALGENPVGVLDLCPAPQ